ncbi:MAG: hypothetical protein AAFS13_09400 [Pseudomonadota bacterium]
MTTADLFHALVACHIVTGAIGLVAFWVPVLSRKGGSAHRYGGNVFTATLMLTGIFAVGISLCTIAAPIATHPHLMHEAGFDDANLIRAIFGWMMLFLAILTINLVWYGWRCVRVRRHRDLAKTPVMLGLQAILLIAAANCALQGVLVGQILMVGMSLVGVATVATNLWYLYKPAPHPMDWLVEHLKGLVGAGISVYTAFLAFGSVRLLPEAALNPALWAVPLSVGLGIIIYHRRKLLRPIARTAEFNGVTPRAS